MQYSLKGTLSTSVHCGRALSRRKSFSVIQKLRTFRLRLIIGLYLCNLRQQQAYIPLDCFALDCKGTIRLSNTIGTFVISVLQKMMLVKCTPAMHTGG